MADDNATQPGVSKSAKKRAAAKKAAEARAEEAPAPAPPAPAPAPKAEPKAKASAKAEAKPKAKAEPAPAAPAEPKAKAKAKAKAEAPAPKAPEPKPEPKAEAKAKAKAKAKAEPAPPPPKAEPVAPAPPPKAKAKAEGKASGKAAPKGKAEAKPEPPPKKEEVNTFVEIDDGTGGEWEMATGLTKKQQRRKDRVEGEAEDKAAASRPQQHIPGLAPPVDPKAKAKAGAKFDPSVAAKAGAAAAADAIARANAAAADAAPKVDPTASTATIKVPENKIGIVIGPKGAKIKLIQEKTGVNRIDTSGEIFTITGPAEAVAAAEAAIRQLIEKGYTALAYDNFKEDFVSVHPAFFPDIIGKQGAVIRKIKEELSVEVSIPEVPKGTTTSSKKYKVAVAGPTAGVEKAKLVIEDIMKFGHSEVTHPGIVHEELEVAEWLYRFLIGKAGSELRHIQNSYKVKVNIPRENSLCQNVVVYGEQHDVTRAKTYIEKVLWNAEHAPRGRDKQDEGDVWGDEEAEEEWMKPFIFKR